MFSILFAEVLSSYVPSSQETSNPSTPDASLQSVQSPIPARRGRYIKLLNFYNHFYVF